MRVRLRCVCVCVAQVVGKLETQFWGDRTFGIKDPFGHKWTFATHVEDVEPEEMKKRMASWGTSSEAKDMLAGDAPVGEDAGAGAGGAGAGAAPCQ